MQFNKEVILLTSTSGLNILNTIKIKLIIHNSITNNDKIINFDFFIKLL